ncbi:hypothetical protein [Hydrogenimonas sp. SS33]|uniref:hypothetical protein n=1 Tax=Hydrogenimonas leucolamina TaxID=2954236 RepID=UPI00336BE708
MAFKLHIEAEGRRIGFYRVNRLEFEGVEIDPDMEFDRENIQELFENINAYIESGELEELDSGLDFTTFDPDTARITLDADNQEEVEVEIADLTLDNIDVDKKLDLLEKARIGDVIFIRTETGDAYWDLSGEGEASFNLEKVRLGYLDCTKSHDQYDVLREAYCDYLCDLVLPEHAYYGDEKLELDEHVLRTNQVWGELYIVRENLPDHRKEYERVDMDGPILLDTTYTTEEFS